MNFNILGCSKPCGKGEITRTRSCSNPHPQHGGSDCNGDSIQQRPCYLKKCGESIDLEKLMSRSDGNKYNLTQKPIEDDVILEAYDCDGAPYVYGFLGPFQALNNFTEKRSANKAESVYYVCYQGKVIDTRTNSRSFSITCSTGPEFDYPIEWPTCVDAQFCVGPSIDGSKKVCDEKLF